MFHGAITALITPFKNGKIDELAFQDLIEWQINQGIHGLVPCGTTGESPTLSTKEHNHIIELCVEASIRRVPVIAGTGSNSTDEAIKLTQHAKKAGADAALICTPYYNKPNQEGLYQHFKAIHDNCDIPIVLYNIPGRSVVDMADETIAKLALLPNIVGLKDATGNLARVSSLRDKISSKFCLLSGEDITQIGFNAQGGHGVISVTSNVLPKFVANIQNLWERERFKSALELHDKLVPIHQAMFASPSPGPAKYALSLLGKCKPDVRMPLTEPDEATKKSIETGLKDLHLI